VGEDLCEVGCELESGCDSALGRVLSAGLSGEIG
jgi:hypothetical protein